MRKALGWILLAVSSVWAVAAFVATATTMPADLAQFWNQWMSGFSVPALLAFIASVAILGYVYFPSWRKWVEPKQVAMTSDNAGRPLNFTQNIAQHGSGVAAGVYINRAPPPSVAVTSETGWESNGAGGFVKTLHVSVTSAGAIAGVRVLALGKIQELSAFPKVGGVFQTGHSGIRDDGQFLTVQSVGNWGGITITTTDPDTAELRMEIIG